MRPVENISYDKIRGASEGSKWPASNSVDRLSFMGKLRTKTGLDFDLPTEAQWEYACHAGTASKYNNGGDSEDDLKKLGRYKGDGEDGKGGHKWVHTGVGAYESNAWGLYDMHGNVWEFCLDWCGDLSGGVTDPKGPSTGSSRRLCGGGYADHSCYSFDRIGMIPSDKYADRGFRLALPLAE